ncbi:DUF5682 family protein [Yinghuangia soli]|uniref:DUF5682 family protein n=1 Tax=Yinghuangia soli TaxID=2908204 RepID=A0AA41Q7D1_9ACTN|nr:DUF5682 family protein [Yinghuangia soli]MCF2532571.1 DUF5682 family protein [Yinghuangia soli]
MTAQPSTATGPTGPAAETEPGEAAERLAASEQPVLIGVRHHAPSLAAAMPALLDAARPEVLLVELPADLQDWIGWLAHEDTKAPVALAGSGPTGLGFYPFAEFSPELAAVRWAARHQVPVIACDLPLGLRSWAAGRESGDQLDDGPAAAAAAAPHDASAPTLHHLLGRNLSGRPGEDLWDRLVEAAAAGCPPEAVRRAALMVGWAMRRDAEHSGGVDRFDLLREAWMRQALRAATAGGARAAAVVGAFHTPGLLADDPAYADDSARFVFPEPSAYEPVVTSLVPYTYALLDERSGYPAGIRDPEWQHEVYAAAGDPAALHELLVRTATRISAELRVQGHPSGPADAREVVRMAGDLARLRGLPAAGRGELIEAVQTTLAHGEALGRGRAVAVALERVLVGTRAGRRAPGTPRSGLGPAVEAELAELGLPGPHVTGKQAGEERDLRLDPMRTPLDRRRELLLKRLNVCRVPYAEAVDVVGTGGADALTTRWRVRWTPSAAAMLDIAGVRGVTAAQAAEGVLRERRRREHEEGGPTAAQVLAGLEQAAECGLADLATERMREVDAILPSSASLPELLSGLALMERLAAGHIPGLDGVPDETDEVAAELTAAAVRQLDGLAGSEEPADARALVELARRADAFGGTRLPHALAALAADGSPMMAAAAGSVRVLLGQEEAGRFGVRVASWLDEATTTDRRADLVRRLTGVLTAAGPLLSAGGEALDPLLSRVVELPDEDFLVRLPALRGGFDTLSPAARERLLAVIEERLDDRIDTSTAVAPESLAAWAAADLHARAALKTRGLWPLLPTADTTPTTPRTASNATAESAPDTSPSSAHTPNTGSTPDSTESTSNATAESAPKSTSSSALTPNTESTPDSTESTSNATAESAPDTTPTTPKSASNANAESAPDTTPSSALTPNTGSTPDSTESALASTESTPDGSQSTQTPIGSTPELTHPTGSLRTQGAHPLYPHQTPTSTSQNHPAAASAPPLKPAASAATGPGATLTATATPAPSPVDNAPEAPEAPEPSGAPTLTPQARWRLVLGRRADPRDSRAARLGAALDELYGAGRGEGSRGDLGGATGAGREASYPSVRDWAEDLAALFGPAVREEVLGAAVAAGRRDALTALDPDAVRPSVDLLRAVLEHAGGLPESRVAALRPLVERMVAELTRELSTRMRPALSGLTIPRPSRRPGGGLDLARTLRANLATARPNPGGGVTVVPEKPVFRTKARRSADWRLILVVDVSGSMEASTIWSALTASILAGVPALTTHFVAFSTEVVDFTDQVHDPLGLLLDVRIGGGTHIAAGLRYARELVTVPSRTLVAVVSDFEEGWPLSGLLGEVRGLVNAGVHVLGCASLDDRGKPRYSTAVATQLVAAGMPVAALSPTELARWVGEKVR